MDIYKPTNRNPTKMCIKSASYFHQKSANEELNLLLYLMLWCYCYLENSSQIALLEGAVPASISKKIP